MIVKISKRPNIIQKLVKYLAKTLSPPQLSAGPTPASPGPILPIEAADAERAVIKSKPVADKSRDVTIKIKI